MNVTFYAIPLIEPDKSISESRLKLIYFCINEFEVCVNNNIFSGNEQQKVYWGWSLKKKNNRIGSQSKK